MNQELLANFTRNIADLLLVFKIKQSEIAQLTNCAQSTVSKYIKKQYGSARELQKDILYANRDYVIRTFTDAEKGNFRVKETLGGLNLDKTKRNQVLLQEFLKEANIKKKCKADGCEKCFFDYNKDFCSMECMNMEHGRKRKNKIRQEQKDRRERHKKQYRVFDQRTKFEILFAQNFTCPLCGNPIDPFIHEKYHPAFMTCDHIESVKVGFENKIIVHRTCNLFHGRKRINELSLQDYRDNFIKKLNENIRPDLREFRMEFFSDVTVAKLSVQHLGKKYNTTYQNIDSLCTQLLPYKPHREPLKKKRLKD